MIMYDISELSFFFIYRPLNSPIAINPACGEAYIRGNPLCWRTSPIQTDVCYMKVIQIKLILTSYEPPNGLTKSKFELR